MLSARHPRLIEHERRCEVVVDGLELDGALHLTGTGCARGLLRDAQVRQTMKLRPCVAGLQVQNRGVSIVGIPDSELAEASPSHQIRGRSGFSSGVPTAKHAEAQSLRTFAAYA